MIQDHAGRAALHFLTDFADQAVVLPVLAVVVLALFRQGWMRGAGSWLLAASGCLGLMFLLKLGFGLRPLDGLRSPSGHAAVAALVGGGLAALVMARRPRLALAAALVGGLLAALVVGYTRVALEQHTLEETLLGGAVGTVGAGVLAALQGAVPAGVRRWQAGAAALAVALALHGTHLNAERLIRHLVVQVGSVWV